MALYSLVDKPKWLTSTQKASTAATAGGWVYTRPDGTAETLVAINRMTTKMIPVVRSVVTDEDAYEVGTATVIDFTVYFNRNIKSSDITSATVLNFLIDESEFTATYRSKTSTSVTFRYTIPSNGDEYEIPEASAIGLDSITLNTGEHIYLDFADSNISADLTLPETIDVPVTQKVPEITGVTTDKASYAIGTDTEIEFTVSFDRDVKSLDLTSATTLDFTINTTHSFTAAYTSESGNDVVFTWTIPDPYTGGPASTTIALDSITLNTDEDIILDSTANTISADLTSLPASINVTITLP